MEITKLSPLEFTASFVSFGFWFIVNPILYIATINDNLFWINILTCICSPFALFSIFLSLKKMAEPFEIERLNKGITIFNHISKSLSYFNAAILLTGLLMIISVYNAKESLKIPGLCFGGLFVILSLRFWHEDTRIYLKENFPED